jgi:hypothetical protein
LGCSDPFKIEGVGKVQLQGIKPEAKGDEVELAITRAPEDLSSELSKRTDAASIKYKTELQMEISKLKRMLGRS